jgi:hypothetical protein
MGFMIFETGAVVVSRPPFEIGDRYVSVVNEFDSPKEPI